MVQYLKENMAALDLVLTQEDIDAVRKAALKADKVKVGERVSHVFIIYQRYVSVLMEILSSILWV